MIHELMSKRVVKIQKFEDFEIWKLAIEIVKEVYKLTATGKWASDFGLRDQIRRATVSISSNIVEGFERNNNNEFIRFLKIAKGSVGEARNQLHIALAVGYIHQEQYETLNKKLENESSQIGAFISYLEGKRKNKEFIIR